MKMLSYHGKMKLRKALTVLGILALVLLLVWLCWMVWLQRYMVYSRQGVTFDFKRSTMDLSHKEPGQAAVSETIALDISIVDPGEQIHGLQPLSGIYADTAALTGDFAGVEAKLSNLERDTAVMLDVKSKFGNFYYTTSMNSASLSTAVDAADMDRLIQDLNSQDVYLIARVPAFRDSAFAEENRSCGLALSSGALWADEENCYWLDPANQAVITNLIQLCQELQDLGFDEVVFTDFRIPDSGSIDYNAAASKDQILREAARQLVNACASDRFVISFVGRPTFTLPQGQSRLYLDIIAPEQVASSAEKSLVTDKTTQLVFLTDTRDTRFDGYSVLRRVS